MIVKIVLMAVIVLVCVVSVANAKMLEDKK